MSFTSFQNFVIVFATFSVPPVGLKIILYLFILYFSDLRFNLLFLHIYSTAYKQPKWSSCRIGCHPFSFSNNHPKMPDI